MTTPQTALVVGVDGAAGALLAAALLARGTYVVGVAHNAAFDWRRTGREDTPDLHVVRLDATDAAAWRRLVDDYAPQEIYHFLDRRGLGAAGVRRLETTHRLVATCTHLLDLARAAAGSMRLVQVLDAAIYGRTAEPIDATTPPRPTSALGTAHLFAYALARVYRTAHDVYAANAVLLAAADTSRGERADAADPVTGLQQILRAATADDYVLAAATRKR